jgi:predicted MFS family arabinose efflux permease
MTEITRTGKAALLVGHCAGMLDLVALPIWVGTLIGWYKLDPQQAGLLVSLFLAGQVISSVVLAPMFTRIPARIAAIGGFTVAALSFLGVSQSAAYLPMMVLHLVGGLGAGCALSVTHGTIGRSGNPHRLFAAAGLALGIFALFMLGGGTKLATSQGGGALFLLFAGVMLVAVIAAMAGFPDSGAGTRGKPGPHPRLSPQVWFGMAAMSMLALAQAAMFSFVERIGVRSHGADAVSAALLAVGILTLFPPLLAAWLQHRVRAEVVIVVGPLAHAAIAYGLTHTDGVVLYVVLVASLLAVVMITHTFLFGLLARLDTTGRAVAATPAMLMIGAAVGPFAGGTVVKFAGYGALGVFVACVGAAAAVLFLGARARNIAPLLMANRAG